MGIEQSLYDELNPLSDAQLQEKTPSPTPSAPTAPASEPQEPQKEEQEDKKGISITTILIGGSLLLGFIYYLKKKN